MEKPRSAEDVIAFVDGAFHTVLTVRFIAPTNTRGTRYSVRCGRDGKAKVYPADYALTPTENAQDSARDYALGLDWVGDAPLKMVGGPTPHGWTFVLMGRSQ